MPSTAAGRAWLLTVRVLPKRAAPSPAICLLSLPAIALLPSTLAWFAGRLSRRSGASTPRSPCRGRVLFQGRLAPRVPTAHRLGHALAQSRAAPRRVPVGARSAVTGCWAGAPDPHDPGADDPGAGDGFTPPDHWGHARDPR